MDDTTERGEGRGGGEGEAWSGKGEDSSSPFAPASLSNLLLPSPPAPSRRFHSADRSTASFICAPRVFFVREAAAVASISYSTPELGSPCALTLSSRRGGSFARSKCMRLSFATGKRGGHARGRDGDRSPLTRQAKPSDQADPDPLRRPRLDNLLSLSNWPLSQTLCIKQASSTRASTETAERLQRWGSLGTPAPTRQNYAVGSVNASIVRRCGWWTSGREAINTRGQKNGRLG